MKRITTLGIPTFHSIEAVKAHYDLSWEEIDQMIADKAIRVGEPPALQEGEMYLVDKDNTKVVSQRFE